MQIKKRNSLFREGKKIAPAMFFFHPRQYRFQKVFMNVL